ncbi:MAG TPA: glutathione S-transferase family protein [Stellaceae bacterium]
MPRMRSPAPADIKPITFYYGSGSPFAWKVWLALEHKRLPYVLRRLSFDAGDLRTPAYAAINPRRKVPAIVDDGFALYESGVIVEYLEDKYAGSGEPLWPHEARTRATARRVTAEVDAYVSPLIVKLTALVFSPPGPDAAAIAEAKQAVAGELPLVARSIAGDFIAGASASAADFTLYPFLALLGRADDRHPGHRLRTLIPERLRAWMTRVEALPYFAATYPPHWRE